MVSAEGLSAYLSVVKSSAKCMLSREVLDRLPAFLGILLDRLRVAPCLAGKKKTYFLNSFFFMFFFFKTVVNVAVLGNLMMYLFYDIVEDRYLSR